MRRTFLTTTILLFAALAPAQGDEELAPWPHITSSASGRFYFRMQPARGKSPALGTMLQVTDSGKDEVRWSVSGWYAQQVFVVEGGESLVRLGNWPRGLEPKADDLGVAFYTRGKLVKSYSTLDLVKDLGAVRPTVSHYDFLDRDAPPALVGLHVDGSFHHVLRLRSVDGITWLFDSTSGEVVHQSPSEKDIVADAETALAIAKAVLQARFGADWQQAQPLRATRSGDEWLVDAPRLAHGKGSAYHVRMQSRDGCILRLERLH